MSNIQSYVLKSKKKSRFARFLCTSRGVDILIALLRCKTGVSVIILFDKRFSLFKYGPVFKEKQTFTRADLLRIPIIRLSVLNITILSPLFCFFSVHPVIMWYNDNFLPIFILFERASILLSIDMAGTVGETISN